MVTIIMVTIKCRWAGMQASGSRLRALQTFNFCLLLDNMGSKNFFGGTNFSIELKCRWTGMQASGSPRVPSHLTQGGTILCKAVGIGANCHSKGIWNKIHGHQTFITFNTKYGAWMKKKYSRGGIWQNCSFKACFFSGKWKASWSATKLMMNSLSQSPSPPRFVNCVQEMYLMVLWAQCFPPGL